MIRSMSAVAAFLGALSSAGAVQAKTFIVEQSISPYVSCYNKEYVPAEVQVNTRGRLVRGTSQYWQTGDQTWNVVRNPSVYIETRRVVSPDHYTLVPTGCPQ